MPDFMILKHCISLHPSASAPTASSRGTEPQKLRDWSEVPNQVADGVAQAAAPVPKEELSFHSSPPW